jgi:hypothetical protein
MTPESPNKPRPKRDSREVHRLFDFGEGALVKWGSVLTVVFLGASLAYKTSSAFASDFFMDAAFTVVGSVLIAIILNRLLQTREAERWAVFDISNLEHARFAIHVLLFHSLARTSLEVSIRANNSLTIDVLEFMHIETRTNLTSFQRYTAPLQLYLTQQYENDASQMGEVILQNPLELEKALDRLEEAVKYIGMSPYAPIGCLTTLRELSKCRTNLIEVIRNNWTVPINTERQKEAVAALLLHTNKAAFAAYEVIAREIEKRGTP